MNGEYSSSDNESNSSNSSSEVQNKPTRPGLGYRQTSTTLRRNLSNLSSSSDLDSKSAGLPSSFGGARARLRKKQKLNNTIQQKDELNQPLGDWEKHTTGFGSKILAKHGFTGLLGAKADGIANPIQPITVKGKKGLGALASSKQTLPDVDRIRQRDRATAWNSNDLHSLTEQQNESFDSNNPQHVFNMLQHSKHKLDSIKDTLYNHVNLEQVRAQEHQTDKELLIANVESVARQIAVLTDTTQAQCANARRNIDTEKMIIGTIEETTAKTDDTIEEADQAIAQLRTVMDNLQILSIEQPRSSELDQKSDKRFEHAFHQTFQLAKGMSCERNIINCVSEIGMKRIELMFNSWMDDSLISGRAAKGRATHIRSILSILKSNSQPKHYLQICGSSILRPIRRKLTSLRGVDIIRAACVADALRMLGSLLPSVVGVLIGEEIIAPRLVAELKDSKYSQRGTNGYSLYSTMKRGDKVDKDDIPAHVWIHPWVAVCGRNALAQPLGYMRIHITSLLEKWSVEKGFEVTLDYVRIVEKWKDVLSKSKLQLALIRHVASKLCNALASCNTPAEVENILQCTNEWAKVCSTRLLVDRIKEGWMKGPAKVIQQLVFDDRTDLVREAEQTYISWKNGLSGRFGSRCRYLLAVLLFLLHAGKVTVDVEMRKLLKVEDVSVLADNRFREQSI